MKHFKNKNRQPNYMFCLGLGLFVVFICQAGSSVFNIF